MGWSLELILEKVEESRVNVSYWQTKEWEDYSLRPAH